MLAQTSGSNPKTSVNDQKKNVSLQVEQRICTSGFHFSLLNGMFSTSQMITKEIIQGFNLHTKCPILIT